MTLAMQVPTTAMIGGHLSPQLISPLGHESPVPPSLVYAVLGTTTKVLCTLGKHSTN